LNGPVTLDASVFVNAFSPTETGSDTSVKLLDQLRQNGIVVVVPTLLLPEIAAAIARKQGQVDLALVLTDQVRKLPNLTLVPLDEALAESSAETAAHHRLRGSDAVYAAVALRFGSLLVTLDFEQSERLKDILSVHSPTQALESLEKRP
jgi:predicted nucleic acid-binding protein